MEKFFVAHLGVQSGPWTIEEIKYKLNQKSLFWNDYFFDEKSKDWILILESSHFTELFNRSFKTPIKAQLTLKSQSGTASDRTWYILKQENNYGPFTHLEMIQMLQSKTLFEFDFIWNHSLDSWKRLAEVPDFKPENIKQVFETQQIKTVKDKEIFFRRKHSRAQFVSSILLHDRKKLFNAQSIEISAGGAGFVAESVHFDLDKHLYLHFRPSEHVPAFNAICKVVSKVGSKYGVRFLHVSAAAKEKIAQYTTKETIKAA